MYVIGPSLQPPAVGKDPIFHFIFSSITTCYLKEGHNSDTFRINKRSTELKYHSIPTEFLNYGAF